MSTSNGSLLNKNATDVLEDHPASQLPAKEIDVVSEDHLNDSGQNIKFDNADVSSKIVQERSESATIDSPVKCEAEIRDAGVKVESQVSQKNEDKVNTQPVRVQDQLDEAQGLLKTTNSTGQSKEARLARVCAGLSSRLQEYKSENAQMEEILVAESQLTKSYKARIQQLQQDLSSSKGEVTRVNMESIMRNRELTETRMMQALREELAFAERRAEEERAAHNATKMAAIEREVESEHGAIDAATALARIQRVADERTAKAAELEQKVALLEVECATLNQELQDMEARSRRGQKKSPEEATQMIQAEVQKMRVEMASMKREAEHYSCQNLVSLRTHLGYENFCCGAAYYYGNIAEKLSLKYLLEPQNHIFLTSLQVYDNLCCTAAPLQAQPRKEHMELEKCYRELTDLLYYKQTQLETMASEKAAAEFQLEKEIKRLQEAHIEAERSRVSRQVSSSWEEDTEMKALEPLPLYHRHMAAASIQLQKAAKLLDSGRVRAIRFLWRYPTARVILLFHLVFVTLFLMYLMHRLEANNRSHGAKEAHKMLDSICSYSGKLLILEKLLQFGKMQARFISR
ncbi:hypothetical protein SLEP1_g18552 [Rubroshorea leprosula]|uniref:Golgin candidate 1 n=1 Tax=Rubroshorea leprosula TaxID=152421 RepID=A0AAV5J3F1_9ROSI|nr:hypothetical protein SLEP1_g18552 [Rubroshorea leprosula]